MTTDTPRYQTLQEELLTHEVALTKARATFWSNLNTALSLITLTGLALVIPAGYAVWSWVLR